MKNTPHNTQITHETPLKTNVHTISDNDLYTEYVKRFTLHAGDTISSSKQAALHIRPYFQKDPLREKLFTLYLNGRNQVIETREMFAGTLTTSAVYPREIIRTALEIGAVAIILFHNHPSGNLSPSRDDIKLTQTIISACKLVEITVHDHIIIGDSFTSMADKGLI